MWQTEYASAVPKNFGLGLNFWPCSEGYHLICSENDFQVEIIV